MALIGLSFFGYGQCTCNGDPDLEIRNLTDDEFCVEIWDGSPTSSGCPEIVNIGAPYCTKVNVPANSTVCVTTCQYAAEIRVTSTPISSNCKFCSPYSDFSAAFSLAGSSGPILGCFTGYTRTVNFFGCQTCGTPPQYNFANNQIIEITP